MEDTTVSTKKKNGEKKRKAPKVHPDELEPTEDVQIERSVDQEVPVVKPKKKRTPKVAVDDEQAVVEEPVKKKKSKKPKVASIEDDFQIIEVPTIDEFETPIEEKPKQKKSKKSKKVISESFDNPEIPNEDLPPGISISINQKKIYFLF
jgi:hypothetical protein